MPHRVHQANKTKIFDNNVLRVHFILQRLHPFSISASAGLRTTLTSLKTMWLAVRPFKRRSALRWIGILRTKISLNFVGLFFFVMSDCPKGECVDAYWNFRTWKLGLKVFKLSVLSDSQNHSVYVMIDFDLCHDWFWGLFFDTSLT